MDDGIFDHHWLVDYLCSYVPLCGHLETEVPRTSGVISEILPSLVCKVIDASCSVG